MQTIKSFIFIILLFNSFNVLSEVCKKLNGASIPNSTFIPDGKEKGKGKCTCNSGYSLSGFSRISTTNKDKFNNDAKCTEHNNWVVPLVIGGGALAATVGVAHYGRKRYKAYKARLNAEHAKNRINSEDLEEPWEEWGGWEGTEGEYLQSDGIYSRPLRGVYKLKNLTDPETNPLLTEQQTALDTSPEFHHWNIADASTDTGPQIKYDPVTKSNVMVDSEGRVFSRWNADSQSWKPAQGAERWRYSDRLGYRVIAKNNDNFLNPNTGNFQADEWESSWQGQSGTDYIADFKIYPKLQGSGSPLESLSISKVRLDPQFSAQYAKYGQNVDNIGSVSMKYDQSTKSNVLVDKQDRLLKSWNRTNQRWEPADGAERWRYSETLQYKVIAKSNTDFLNPRTGEFETIPTDNEWSGEFMADRYFKAIDQMSSEAFKGVGDPLNVTTEMKYDIRYRGEDINDFFDPDLPYQRSQATRYSFFDKEEATLSRNLDDNKSVLVDRDKRLLANWNEDTLNWDPVEGAARWRFSTTLKYNVLSTSDSNMYNPITKTYQEVVGDNAPWEGSISEYTEHPSISGHSLKGVGRPLEGLTDPEEGAELSLQKQNISAYNFAQNKNIRIKFDPASGENVVVDNNQRVLARWDAGEGANEWKAVDGAERWEFHPKFGYDVISTDSTNGIATNYLNPHTGKFVNTKDEGWEADSMESSDIFSADVAPATRIRVIAIVHQNRAYLQEEIDTQNVDVESGITDFELPLPLNPAASLEGKELDDFDLFKDQTVDFNPDSSDSSDSDIDLDEYIKWGDEACVQI